jgi:hypothetical protein
MGYTSSVILGQVILYAQFSNAAGDGDLFWVFPLSRNGTNLVIVVMSVTDNRVRIGYRFCDKVLASLRSHSPSSVFAPTIFLTPLRS